jgi:alpha-ketoglutarate-dependent taurine dioxygenase
MSDQKTISAARPSPLHLPVIRRPGRQVSTADLVRFDGPLDQGSLPHLVRPATKDVDLVGWADRHASIVRARLQETGALLFRGFALDGVPAFEAFMRALCGELLAYTYRSTPRSNVTDRIYTSTEYPAHQSIALHNEMSYSRTWPLVIAFHCLCPAERGGETPIADSRAVYRRVPAPVRERFARQQVMYVRNYGGDLDLSWQDVFQTEDPADVERYCRTAGIELEWRGGGQLLRTRQVCQATAQHPETGEPVWFNQAHLFHWSNGDPAVQDTLRAHFGDDEVPRNACYGNGDPIEVPSLEAIRSAFASEAQTFAWQRGDVLLLDNMLVAHGRAPFTGRRQVVVAMGQEVRASDGTVVERRRG